MAVVVSFTSTWVAVVGNERVPSGCIDLGWLSSSASCLRCLPLLSRLDTYSCAISTFCRNHSHWSCWTTAVYRFMSDTIPKLSTTHVLLYSLWKASSLIRYFSSCWCSCAVLLIHFLSEFCRTQRGFSPTVKSWSASCCQKNKNWNSWFRNRKGY